LDKKSVKELMAVLKKIAEHSGSIGLHTGASGSNKEAKMWSGLSCGSIKGDKKDKSTSTQDASV
jgi:hypothetical protein